MFLLNSDLDKNITEIALSVVFSNLASFAKAFKKAYGLSASEFRQSKNRKQENNNGKVINSLSCYNNDALKNKLEDLGTIDPCWVKVKKIYFAKREVCSWAV